MKNKLSYDNHYWLQNWKHNYIPFHKNVVNPLLEQYLPQLQLPSSSHVLVPLCGKSLDMLWLLNQGYRVIGIEMSNIACEAFFDENKLPITTRKYGGSTIYSSQQIDLYCGDIFALSTNLLPNIAAIYDRAAFIALPPTTRQQYVQHLCQFIAPTGQMLLIVISSSDKVQGPPYIVSAKEIEQLFSGRFEIIELVRVNYDKISQHLYDKGYRKCSDIVYHLK